jgi:glyoxylase-like metal-dependent hydrolase (beta-lactamase superfamily II)
MNLEDSIGDILRKARISTQTALDVAASAAGLSPELYQQLESAGRLDAPVQWEALGSLLTLNGPRLRNQYDGWRPKPVDLAQWRELRVVTTSGDDMAVNAYLVWDEPSREAALFDTGFDAAPILDLISANQLSLRHIFITHAHPDHVAALAPIRQAHPKARLHSSSRHAPVEQRNRPHDFTVLGSLRISHRDTPGHAEDGVTYIVGNWPDDAAHVAVVGDALFAGSIGGAREHLELARQSIRAQLFSLPDSTLVCPGHGPLSTMLEEKSANPWFD